MAALPFPLPPVSAALAEVSATSREVGRRAAERVAAALAAEIGGPVEVSGRALPALPAPAPGLVRLGLRLEALPADALLEVEAALAARLADRLAGGDGRGPAALSLTPVERSLVQVLALVAIAGAVDEEPVAELAPRLAPPAEVAGPLLCVEVLVAAGPVRGRCRLLLPPAAVRALGRPAELPPAVAAWPVEGWLAGGSAALSADEIAGLAPGDVVLLDAPAPPRAELRLPGLRLAGREGDGVFHLEEMSMTESAAALPLTLAVEVARVSLTLADLARLEPGSAFPLQAPRDGRVVLRLGERPVARGQLVEIEGALGVRVESLEARP
jgi:type III secretion protein Q